MGVNIRTARLEDAARIAEFNNRLAEETEDKSLDLQLVTPGVEALLSDELAAKFRDKIAAAARFGQ